MSVISYIDLLRHGETINHPRYCGSTDTPLTINGQMQMWEVSERTPPGWDHMITSPLIRCAAFAKVFSKNYTIPCTVDDRLKEMHFGDWENYSAAELMQKDADTLASFWNNPVLNTPPNGERFSDFRIRILSAWHDITSKHAGKKTLLITHGGVIRTILCHILQHPVERILEFNIGHATIQRIQIKHKKSQNYISLITHMPT